MSALARPPAIAMIDVAALQRELGAAALAAIEQVAARGSFILGPEVEAFEEALAKLMGAPHAVGVGCCSDALVIALRCAGVQPGDVVVVPALSFVATAEAALRCGATPCFVDVEPERLTLCPRALDSYLARCEVRQGARFDRRSGGRVRAVVPVHLYGRVADVSALAKACGDDIALVHDAAQAIGASAAGESGALQPLSARAAGESGALQPLSASGPACLSFFPTKNLGAWGDGGAILFRDHALAEQARRLRRHGRDADGRYVEPGYNSRLDTLQAAVLLHKLEALPAHHARRMELAARYREAFAAAAIERWLQDAPALRPGEVPHLYTVRVQGGAEQRAQLQRWLRERGIGSRVYYARPLSEEPAFREAIRTELQHTERACEQVLSLPLHPYLSNEDVRRVVETIVAFFGERAA